MTIHTKWMELLRGEATDAFHHSLDTGVVEASFIDGQIKLMKGESIQTWWVVQTIVLLIPTDFVPIGPISFTPNSLLW